MANKEAEPMRISFRKLDDILSKNNKRWSYLREIGISPGIVGKMKDGTGHVDTRTIQKICREFQCQPGDIMEYKKNDEAE